jgi:uncharacterized membrane protein
MNRSGLLTASTAAGGWIALAALALPAASVPRIVIGVAFVACGPGAAVVGLARALLRRRGRRLDGWEAAMLVVVVSVSLCALVAEAFYLTHSFTTPRCTIVLAVLTSIAALWPVEEPGPPRNGAGAVSVARRGRP